MPRKSLGFSALVAVVLVVAPSARAQVPFPPPTPNPVVPGVLPTPSGQGQTPATLGYTTTTQLTTVAAAPRRPLTITFGGGPVATFLARRHVFSISHQAYVPVVTPTVQTVQYQAVTAPAIQYVVPVQVQVPVQQTYQAPPPPPKGTPQAAAAFQYAPTFNAQQPTAQPVYMQAVPGKPGLFRLCNPPTSSNDSSPSIGDEAAPETPKIGSTATQ
jgi:hypothetical protein